MRALINKDLLREGVRLVQELGDVTLYSANGKVIGTISGTDIASCSEALNRESIPFYECVPDSMIQITRA